VRSICEYLCAILAIPLKLDVLFATPYMTIEFWHF
jgi:hypothetical protein